MEKLNAFLRNNVSSIAIGLSVVGIVTHLLRVKVGFAKHFKVVNLHDPFDFIIEKFLNGPIEYDLLSILFLGMLGIGGLHYRKSAGKDSRLLKFCFSIITIHSLISLITGPITYFQMKAYMELKSSFVSSELELVNFIKPIAKSAVLIYLSLYLTRWLISKNQIDLIEIYDSGEQKFCSYEEAPKSTRFVHLICDLYLVAMIVLPIFSLISFYLLVQKDQNVDFSLDFDGNAGFLALGFSACVLIFYVLFEGLFQATPTKFLTGTRVVKSVNLKKPAFGSILLRSISRRIPFEPFSFLWNGRWHDALSKTTVVKEKADGWLPFNHRLWIILLVGQYLGVYVYSMI